MMKTINRLVLVLLFLIRIFLSNAHELVDYVNPMIGATTLDNIGNTDLGLGKTFPGVCTPFGLVQLSPDTKTGGDNGSGYSYHHTTIEGFSFTHMSGIGWYGDLGNFLVMPTTGKLHTLKEQRKIRMKAIVPDFLMKRSRHILINMKWNLMTTISRWN